jgi:acyl-CoA synthetase (AMP-forming)/AMP-acid ligase II
MHLFTTLLERARAEPNGVFCWMLKGQARQQVSNAAVVAEAQAFASRLRTGGVRPGGIVPIVLEHRRELYSTFIGCTLIDAVPAFLPPSTHKQDPTVFRAAMQALLTRIAPACVVGSAATLRTLPVTGVPTIDVDARPPRYPFDIPATVDASPRRLALLQHSSGTTGLKKGVCLTHGVVLRQLCAYSAALGVTRHDSVVSWLPLYHDMGLITSFLLPALLGIPVVSMDPLEWVLRPTLLLDEIQRMRTTLCWMPNFAFHHIARLAEPGRRWDLSSIRLLISCSEPCRAAAFDVFLDRFAASGIVPDALQASYAMAENVFAVTQTVLGQPTRRSPHPAYPGFLSSGQGVGNSEFRVAGADGTPTQDLQVGQILVRGDCLFDGYFMQPEITAARMQDGWFATGDLGFRCEGDLFVVGRDDDVLNINGRKLLAHDIEDALNDVAGVAPGRVLVYAEHDAPTGATQLRVLAERSDSARVPDSEIAAAIRQSVLAVCGIRANHVAVVQRGTLLKSTSGKLSRAASLEKLRSTSDQPRTDR